MRPETDYQLAYDLGVKDGEADGESFSMGMTWDDDQDMNEAYDRGVNVGIERARQAGR